jgi:plasmid stabilization system protein ParE
MIRARLSPRAVRDLGEISGYLATDNPEAAERVRRVILNPADFPALHPEPGRRIRKTAPRHLQIVGLSCQSSAII